MKNLIHIAMVILIVGYLISMLLISVALLFSDQHLFERALACLLMSGPVIPLFFLLNRI